MSGLTRRVEQLDPVDWQKLIFAVAAVAGLVRLALIIRYGGSSQSGGYDFRWYQEVGDAARHGNPYTAHIEPPTDVPAAQALVFAALGWGNGVPLRCLFLCADILTILLAGLALVQRRTWRLNLACWIAFNPMLILVWNITVEDKNLYILCVVAAMAAVQAARPYLALAAAGIFTVFKYVGGFLLPPIALMIARMDGWRRAIYAVMAVTGVFVVTQIPWFPDSLDPLSRRQARASFDHPAHTSWTVLLDKLHLYDPIIVTLFMVVGYGAAYGLLLLGRISTVESLGLALIATFIALPDSSPDRVMLLVMLFILITPLTGTGWLLLWLTSAVAALANGLLLVLPGLDGLKSRTDKIGGDYGSVRSVVVTNLPLFTVVTLYALSHLRGTTSRLLVERQAREPVAAA